MNQARPTRVLHIIDGLAGGGSERNVWDIVRLSDPAKVMHRVVTVYPDDGGFIYAARLRQAGAYRRQAHPANGSVEGGAQTSLASVLSSRLSPRFRRPLRPLWQAAKSVRRYVFHALSSPVSADPAIEQSNGSSARPAVNSQPAILEAVSEGLTDAELFMDRINEGAIQRVTKEYLHFRPDVIHGHTFHGFAFGLFLKLIFLRPAMLYQVPCLFSQLKDVEVDWLLEQYRCFHPSVDRFLTAYPAELFGIGVPAEKIHRLEGSVDLRDVDRIKAERERHRSEVRLTLGIGDDTLLALSVGRLHSTKGHSYALEALPSVLKRFPNLHWVVLGTGMTERDRTELELRARELGVDQHTHLQGFVQEPLPFYAAADIYFRTPLLEADNLSSYQAMGMGLPVVGFDTGSETELIPKAGHGLLVPVGDAEALAATAIRILSLPDGGRAMGERGADYCRAHLDFQGVISMLVDVYADLHRNANEREHKPDQPQTGEQ